MPLPIPFAEITKTETALGATFPVRFKEHMSRCNGGEVDVGDDHWQLFPFRDTTSRETIRRSAGDIIHETKEAIASDLGFPADGVAIASNVSGDLLLLRRRGAVLGNEVWRFLLEGELEQILDNVGELWR